jgi:hypothetical protein
LYTPQSRFGTFSVSLPFHQTLLTLEEKLELGLISNNCISFNKCGFRFVIPQSWARFSMEGRMAMRPYTAMPAPETENV